MWFRAEWQKGGSEKRKAGSLVQNINFDHVIVSNSISYADKTDGSKCKESGIALKLGLRKPPDIKVEEYYPTFLSMAKNFMEGMIIEGAICIHTYGVLHSRSQNKSHTDSRTFFLRIKSYLILTMG